MESLKEKTAKGLFWGGVSNGVQQVLNLVFGIFLARMLSQSDYGMVGMLAIFSALASVLQEGGFITALIRKKNITNDDYNSVFWISILMSSLFYAILFFCAPLIANFYYEPKLIALARYTFLGFFITSFSIAPRAYLLRNMMVQKSAIISFISLVVSGTVGVTMAATGYSYWGIATQGNVYVLFIVILSFYYAKWHPTLPVKFSPLKEMIGFSSKLIITNIFNIINGNIFSVLLGKMYTPHEVGNYTQANKWNNMGSALVGSMVGGIAQPVFAKVDDDTVRQKRIFRKLLRFTAFVSFPAMFGLALVAKEFIVILLTEKWLESALMMQMLCIAGAFAPISGLFSNLIITRGHSNTYMWCTIAFCFTQLIAVLLSAPFGINCMIWAYVIISICWILVWHYFACSEIDIKLRDIIADISPYLILTVTLVFAATLLTQNISNLYLRFAIKVIFVAISYCMILWRLGSTIFKESVNFIRKRKIEE